MKVEFHQLKNWEAERLLSWKYPQPYSFYNFPRAQDVLDSLLDGSFYSAFNKDGHLVGFMCTGENAQMTGGIDLNLYEDSHIDIGLGLKPDLTGKGLGLAFVYACMENAENRLGTTSFRLSVAAFNKRARTVYERAGFRAIRRFKSPTRQGKLEFILMTR